MKVLFFRILVLWAVFLEVIFLPWREHLLAHLPALQSGRLIAWGSLAMMPIMLAATLLTKRFPIALALLWVYLATGAMGRLHLNGEISLLWLLEVGAIISLGSLFLLRGSWIPAESPILHSRKYVEQFLGLVFWSALFARLAHLTGNGFLLTLEIIFILWLFLSGNSLDAKGIAQYLGVVNRGPEGPWGRHP